MNTDSIILISDPAVLAVPIKENNDRLVDLHAYPEIRIDHRKSEDSSSYFKVRKTVADKLVAASLSLPGGISFLVVEGHRPLALQKEYFDWYSKELRKAHSDWDKQKIYDEASKYVAPPEVTPPHSTGGAVDLTLMKNGIELDMGAALNADPEESKSACFTAAENISKEAKANRKILIDVLTKAGFVNYPTEWWHWSYGDRYWAYATKAPNAIYGSVEKA